MAIVAIDKDSVYDDQSKILPFFMHIRRKVLIYSTRLYIYGGYDSNSPGIFKDLVYFNFDENKWKEVVQKGDLPGPRHSHTFVLY